MDTNQEPWALIDAAQERPPWADDLAGGDVAFGCYGDGYLEWVNSRYYWDSEDARTTADTRSLWDKRHRYGDVDALYVELNALTSEQQAMT